MIAEPRIPIGTATEFRMSDMRVSSRLLLVVTEIARLTPMYIVLENDTSSFVPYAADWLARSIPDRRVIGKHVVMPGVRDRVVVYRWNGMPPRANPIRHASHAPRSRPQLR